MNYYANKTVFITGGSSGIGLAAAEALARSGSSVAVFARRYEALQDAVAALEAKRGVVGQRFYFGAMDVTDPGSVQAAMSRAIVELGPPDMLITAAGIGVAERFERIDDSTFDDVVRTNLHGTRLAIRELLPHLQQKQGQVVMVGSLVSFIPMYSYSAYCASKYAVAGFAECLRAELRLKGIGVSLFCPPEVDTPFLQKEAPTLPAPAKVLKKFGGRISTQRAARAMLRGAARGRFLIIPGLRAKLLYWNWKLLPGWAFRMIPDIIAARAHKL